MKCCYHTIRNDVRVILCNQRLPACARETAWDNSLAAWLDNLDRFLQGGRPLRSMTMAKMSLRMRNQWLFQLLFQLFRQRCQPQLLQCLRLCQHSHLRLQRLRCRSRRRDVA